MSKIEELIKRICGNYFTFNELNCKCNNCYKNSSLEAAYKGVYKDPECDVKEEFLKKLLLFRILYDSPFRPTSVYRCKNHPDYSTNHDGWAFDIAYHDIITRIKIVKCAINASFKRIGVSKKFIHIDCNPEYNNTMNEEVLWFYKGYYDK